MSDFDGGRGVRRWGLLLVFAFSSQPGAARAELTIQNDDAVPDYTVEIEPHGILTPFWPPSGRADFGLGGGAWIGINLAPRGFIPDVADTVALGLGLDWIHYFGAAGSVGECAQWRGTGDESVCVRVRGGGASGGHFFAPAVMQWSFYLTEKWSFFGEPGLAIYFTTRFYGSLRVGLAPAFFTGARYHFNERVSLTMRVGYPYTTIGVSFFL